MKEYSDIHQLAIRYFNGTITREEEHTLQQFLAGGEENCALFSEWEDEWTVSHIDDADTQNAWETLLGRINAEKEKSKVTVNWRSVLFRAAMLLIVVGSVAYAFMARQKEQYYICKAPDGNKTEIILPDSTHVWLNAGSSLKYSSRFNDDNRNVSLEGEAYFEVTHHDNKKFTVKTDNYDVVVKGTKFDVASYQSDPVSMVSLVKGSVELAYEKGVIDMKPGERVVLDKNTGEFTKEKYTDDSRAWIDNRTELDNISLIDLARVLSRQYDVKIHVQSARLANTHFAVSLRNKETIMDVLDALQMIEPMKITRNKRDIYITE